MIIGVAFYDVNIFNDKAVCMLEMVNCKLTLDVMTTVTSNNRHSMHSEGQGHGNYE